jgi:hypothetical protein
MRCGSITARRQGVQLAHLCVEFGLPAVIQGQGDLGGLLGCGTFLRDGLSHPQLHVVDVQQPIDLEQTTDQLPRPLDHLHISTAPHRTNTVSAATHGTTITVLHSAEQRRTVLTVLRATVSVPWCCSDWRQSHAGSSWWHGHRSQPS